MRSLLLAFALLVGPLAPEARAQVFWEGTAETGAESAQNLLRSPDNVDASVPDSLDRADLRLPAEVEAEVGFRSGAHTVSLQGATEFDRYASLDYLNTTLGEVRAAYAYDARHVDVDAEARWTGGELVRVDILGDDLPRLFRLRQPEARARVEVRAHRAHRFRLGLRAKRASYAPEPDRLDFGNTETALTADWRLRRRENRQTRWSVRTTLELRRRAYNEFRARAADGARSDEHPAVVLDYATAIVEARRLLRPGLTARVSARGRTRTDPFDGWYSYRSASLRADLDWDPRPDLSVSLGGRYRAIGYLKQLAPQEGGGPRPPLRFQYVSTRAEVEYRPSDALTVVGYARLLRRGSNLTVTSFTHRRSYTTHAVGLRLVFDLGALAAGVW